MPAVKPIHLFYSLSIQLKNTNTFLMPRTCLIVWQDTRDQIVFARAWFTPSKQKWQKKGKWPLKKRELVWPQLEERGQRLGLLICGRKSFFLSLIVWIVGHFEVSLQVLQTIDSLVNISWTAMPAINVTYYLAKCFQKCSVASSPSCQFLPKLIVAVWGEGYYFILCAISAKTIITQMPVFVYD